MSWKCQIEEFTMIQLKNLKLKNEYLLVVEVHVNIIIIEDLMFGRDVDDAISNHYPQGH